MALSLPAVLVQEKNKLMSEGAWLILLEINFFGESVYLVRNTEKIIWNGKEWIPYPFDIDDINENSKGELPSLTIKVCNVGGAVQKYIDPLNGGIGAEVFLRVVNSEHLDVVCPDLEMVFTVESSEVDLEWVYFTLGGDDSVSVRFPQRRIIKDFCPYKFKGIECGYNGAVTTCPKTLNACRERGNTLRFGGEPGIPLGGLYASNV